MNYPVTNKIRNDKLIFIFSLILLLYFIFMLASTRFSFGNSVIVGVFREMLDIPALVLLVVFFVISFISFAKERFKIPSYPFYSIIVLLLTVISLITLIKIA